VRVGQIISIVDLGSGSSFSATRAVEKHATVALSATQHIITARNDVPAFRAHHQNRFTPVAIRFRKPKLVTGAPLLLPVLSRPLQPKSEMATEAGSAEAIQGFRESLLRALPQSKRSSRSRLGPSALWDALAFWLSSDFGLQRLQRPDGSSDDSLLLASAGIYATGVVRLGGGARSRNIFSP